MQRSLSGLYAHRHQQDGSHDSICLSCLATICSCLNEDDLIRVEEDHVCTSRFLAKRVRYEQLSSLLRRTA